MWKRTLSTAALLAPVYYYKNTIFQSFLVHNESKTSTLPTRKDMLARLKSGACFDVLIVGGGATGAGCALDASLRGLNVALVEKDDFSSGNPHV